MKLLVWIAAGLALWWLWRNSRLGRDRMSPAEAARILGIDPQAGADDIIAAHKRLISKMHPDAGGSAEIASQINNARDILLRKIG